MYPRCPSCGSYDVDRRVHFSQVLFLCRICGRSFTS
jgi:transposase-like protein